MDYELALDVVEFVPFNDTISGDVAIGDANVDLTAPEIDVLPGLVEVLGAEECAAFAEPAAQSILPGYADYLLRPSSEWTEAEWSAQLFGEPGHTWAEMGFA